LAPQRSTFGGNFLMFSWWAVGRLHRRNVPNVDNDNSQAWVKFEIVDTNTDARSEAFAAYVPTQGTFSTQYFLRYDTNVILTKVKAF
jgi:hypothetical protein